MYHINHEGKVYPCRARVLKCPYGTDMHAETKEELYYKLMKINNDADPAMASKKEIERTGRLRSLYSASSFISRVQYPVEVIVSTLEYAIESYKEYTPESVNNRWQGTFKNASEEVYSALTYGMTIPDFVPKNIKSEGFRLFNERMDGKPTEYAHSTRNPIGLKTLGPLRARFDEFQEYNEYYKWKLTNENSAGTIGWLKEDFYKFSHDLNTSKMITQPIFYGNIEKSEEVIKKMDDYELLAAYDDFLLSDNDVIENVRLANNFDYKFRPDLTMEANVNVKKWYDRNKEIFQNWKRNTPKRILISMRMANELDERGIYRQDNATGR